VNRIRGVVALGLALVGALGGVGLPASANSAEGAVDPNSWCIAADAPSLTRFTCAEIQNSSGRSLVLSEVTDHRDGQAIVENEWLLGEPSKWGFGPSRGTGLGEAEHHDVRFVDWFTTSEWVDLTYVNSSDPSEFVVIRVADWEFDREVTRVLYEHGLDASVVSPRLTGRMSFHRITIN